MSIPDSVGTRAQKNMMTVLETKSVSSESNSQYSTYYRKLEVFSRENGIHWPLRKEEADQLVADYMDVLFLDKKTPSEGEKTLAAVEYFNLEFKGNMARSRRALKGWRKTMPAQSRLPLPRVMMMGICMKLVAKGLKDMALMVIVAFDLYLRPGEALNLRARNVIAPVRAAGEQYKLVTVVVRDFETGVPDKVGVFDNSLKIDNPRTMWIGELLLQKAKEVNDPDAMIFNFTMENLRKEFATAGKGLGVDQLHPYQLRHGGASEDLSSGFRDHNSVKARGRWKTDQSVRRYAKVGRVQQLLTKLNQQSLQFCLWAERNLEKVFRGHVPARSL